MRFFNTLIVFGLLPGILTFTSCSFKQHQVLFQQPNPVANNVPVGQEASGMGTSDYRIRLQIRNLQSTRYIVDQAPVSTTTGANASQGQTFQVDDDRYRLLAMFQLPA
jgi:polysaccharide export outer membrane protein